MALSQEGVKFSDFVKGLPAATEADMVSGNKLYLNCLDSEKSIDSSSISSNSFVYYSVSSFIKENLINYENDVVVDEAEFNFGSSGYASIGTTILPGTNIILELRSEINVSCGSVEFTTTESASTVTCKFAENVVIGGNKLYLFGTVSSGNATKFRVVGAENKSLFIKVYSVGGAVLPKIKNAFESVISGNVLITPFLFSEKSGISSSVAVGNKITDKIGPNNGIDTYVVVPKKVGKVRISDVYAVSSTAKTIVICDSSDNVIYVGSSGLSGVQDVFMDNYSKAAKLYYTVKHGVIPYYASNLVNSENFNFVNNLVLNSANGEVMNKVISFGSSGYSYLKCSLVAGNEYLITLYSDENVFIKKMQLGTTESFSAMVDTLAEKFEVGPYGYSFVYNPTKSGMRTIRAEGYTNSNLKIVIKNVDGVEYDSLHVSVDDVVNSYVNGLKFKDQIYNRITDFKKDTDLMVHVSSFVIINDVVYMTYYVNTQHLSETPSEHRARFVICSLNNLENKRFFDLQGAKNSGMEYDHTHYNGYEIENLYDTILMKKDDDNIFIMWTASFNGTYYRLYQKYTISTDTFGEILINNFKVENDVVEWSSTNMNTAFANNGIKHKALSGDIGIMQKLSTRVENGSTYYYSGCYVGSFNCIVKSNDLITWEFVSKPSFVNSSQWENATYVKGDKVYYFVRQYSTESCAFLTYYDLVSGSWHKPIYIYDAQSRYDFWEFGGNLYLVYSPKDRNHLAVMKIDVSNFSHHEVKQVAVVGDCFYPFVQVYNNELYMSYTQGRQHIYLCKFSVEPISPTDISNKMRELFGSLL